MANPGALQMKKGRWRVYAHLRGYRPQWMTLDAAFICDRIRQWCGVSHDPLQIARAGRWIEQLRAGDMVEAKKDMRYVATSKPETTWQKMVAEWAQWLQYMTMIKCKA